MSDELNANQDVNNNNSNVSATPPAATPPAANPAGNPINYEDLIAKARQQEKDKLYPEITKLKGEIAKLVEKNNALLLTVGEKDQLLSEAEKNRAIAEENAKKNVEGEKTLMEKDKQIADLQKEIEKLKEESAKKDADFKAFIDKAELESYKGGKIKEAAIDPDLESLITGGTKEEVDASIAKALELQEKLKAKYTGGKPAATPGNVPLPKPTSSAISADALKQVDLNNLRNMSREDWAKMRESLGLK